MLVYKGPDLAGKMEIPDTTEKSESPDIKVGLSSANRHNLRGVSSPSVIE